MPAHGEAALLPPWGPLHSSLPVPFWRKLHQNRAGPPDPWMSPAAGCSRPRRPGRGGRQVEKEGLKPHYGLPVPPNTPGGRGLHKEKPGLTQVGLIEGGGGGLHMHPAELLLRATESPRSPEPSAGRSPAPCSPGHTRPLSSARWAPECCFPCRTLLPAWLSPAAPSLSEPV